MQEMKQQITFWSSYDLNNLTNYITYLNKNNLYDQAMSKNSFQQVDDLSGRILKNLS